MRFRLPLVLAAVLLLAGCNSEWWGASGSSTGDGSAAPSPSVTAGGLAHGEEGGANGCPVGAWTLDNESWQAELTRVWRESGAPGAEDLQGRQNGTRAGWSVAG